MSPQQIPTLAPATIPVTETPLVNGGSSPVSQQHPEANSSATIVEPSAVQRMISACAGSLVTSVLVTPLDVVKTRLQSQTVAATPTCARPFTFSTNASAYEKLCQCCREVFFAAPEAPTPAPASATSASSFSSMARSATAAGMRQNMAKLLALSSLSSSSPLSTSISRRIRPSVTNSNKVAAAAAAAEGCGPSISQVHQEGTVVGMKASQAQQQRLERIAANCIESGHAHHHVQERYFHGTWDGVKKIIKYEGASSLWRGLSPTLLMSVPATVIYFVGYDYLKVVLADQMQHLDRRTTLVGDSSGIGQMGVTNHIATFFSNNREALGPLLAGGFARTVAATVISPLELFRTRMQSVHTSTKGNSGLFRGVFQGVVAMVRTEGPLSLWRGLAPTLWRDVPFSAIYWFGYEAIKRELVIQQKQVSADDWRRLNDFEMAFLAGALSGMNAAVLTTPFDVAKTRRQVDLSEPAHHRVWPLMRSILKEEGFPGLWRGLTARVAKVAPSCAIMISSYEVGKKALSEHWWGLGAPSHEGPSSTTGRSGGDNGGRDSGTNAGDVSSSSSGSATASNVGSWALMRDSSKASTMA